MYDKLKFGALESGSLESRIGFVVEMRVAPRLVVNC